MVWFFENRRSGLNRESFIKLARKTRNTLLRGVRVYWVFFEKKLDVGVFSACSVLLRVFPAIQTFSEILVDGEPHSYEARVLCSINFQFVPFCSKLEVYGTKRFHRVSSLV